MIQIIQSINQTIKNQQVIEMIVQRMWNDVMRNEHVQMIREKYVSSGPTNQIRMTFSEPIIEKLNDWFWQMILNNESAILSAMLGANTNERGFNVFRLILLTCLLITYFLHSTLPLFNYICKLNYQTSHMICCSRSCYCSYIRLSMYHQYWYAWYASIASCVRSTSQRYKSIINQSMTQTINSNLTFTINRRCICR